MKTFLAFVVCGLCVSPALAASTNGPAPQQAPGVTYVIPVKGQIERGLVYAIRRGVREAEGMGADVIILDMDTPGGRVDSAQDILHIITGTKAKTYTFVNPNAMSAGAIIAMGTDHIYMAPGGLIGDAKPIMMSPLPLGGPVEMPKGLEEKATSPVEALIRSAAQRKGHNPELAAAMVREEVGYKIGDKVICEKGRLLTLTAKDAEQKVGPDQTPLLSEGTVGTLNELLDKIGRSRDRVTHVRVGMAESIARVIEGFPTSGILLGLGLLLLYVEFKTPGFGLPGISGILLLAVWFWGHHIAGLAGMGEVVLFAMGVLLLLAEIFFFPGFGIAGAAGIVCMLVSLLMATVEHYPSQPWYSPPVAQFRGAILNVGLSLLLTFVAGLLLAKFLPKTHMFQQIMLSSAVSRDAGYRAADPGASLVGVRGVTVTPLRPAGTADFGDRRLTVVSRGQFLEPGARIVVAEAHGNRIVVEPVEERIAGT